MSRKIHGLFVIFIPLLTKAGDDLYFPPSLLSLGEGAVHADLTVFEKLGAQLPGLYDVDIYLNNEVYSKKLLSFTAKENCKKNSENDSVDNTGLLPELSINDYKNMGVKFNNDVLEDLSLKDSSCVDISELIPNAFTEFNFEKMRLNISIPQVSIDQKQKNTIDEADWDSGINALFTNYRFNYSQNIYSDTKNDNFYIGLSTGINFGAWRLRDNRSFFAFRNDYNNESNWQYINSYVERSIPKIRSNIIFGDNITKGSLFDSTGYRGVNISTEKEMYSSGEQGFAPIIRGFANSNSTVEIRQNEYVIYQTNVAPGEFIIDDLQPVSSNGDFIVKVIESVGESQTFTVPYSSLPILLRKGRLSYSLTTGKYRTTEGTGPIFGELTLTKGITNRITQYGGVQYTKNYFSSMLGMGMDIGKWGAISSDITHASTEINNNKYEGQSLRFLYARIFSSLGTNFQLAGYKYSTKDFYTLNNFLQEVDKDNIYYNNVANVRQKEQLQINISQSVGKLGSLGISGVMRNYWNNDSKTISLQAGFYSKIKDINYRLSYNVDQFIDLDHNSKMEHSIYLSLSLPISKLFSRYSLPIYSSYNINRTKNGYAQQINVSGSLLEQQNLDWGFSQGRTGDGSTTNNINTNYRGSIGSFSANYGSGNNYSSKSMTLSGGVVVFDKNILLTQPLGNNNIIISAPGAKNVGVQNAIGIKTNKKGYAVKPYATPYRWNRVALNISDLNNETEIENPVVQIVPTSGAIVKANFTVKKGFQILVKLKDKENKVIPFGSQVTMEGAQGIVGDDGNVYISGLTKDEGTLHAKWGNSENEKCSSKYFFNYGSEAITRLTLVCN